MRLTIKHDGFHGCRTVTMRVRAEGYTTDGLTSGYMLSRRQYLRVNRVVCGLADCRCGEHIAEWYPSHDGGLYPSHDGGWYVVQSPRIPAAATIEVCGNYPQR